MLQQPVRVVSGRTGEAQKGAAKKEFDALATLGDKFPGQADVIRLMQGL
jgi:hypothetical protein